MTNTIWKSIGAVVAGLLVVVVLSLGADALMHATGIFPPPGQEMSAACWVLAAFYRGVFQAGGGYLTARLAPARPMKHMWVLAGIGQVFALLGLLAWSSMGAAGGPLWYPLFLAVAAMPTVWAGGWLHQRRNLKNP